jgi:hypothetical protein
MSSLVNSDLYGFYQLLFTWLIIGGVAFAICLAMYREGQLSMRNARLGLKEVFKEHKVKDLEA